MDKLGKDFRDDITEIVRLNFDSYLIAIVESNVEDDVWFEIDDMTEEYIIQVINLGITEDIRDMYL